MGHEPASPNASSPPREFSTWRIVAVLLVLLPIFIGLLFFFGAADGVNKLRSWLKPELVRAEGVVTFGGQPLEQGNVLTQPANGAWRGGLGQLAEGGRFSLRTDVDGQFLEGVYPGKHKVIVEAHRGDGLLGASAPPSLFPDKYNTFATTPLEIDVSSAAEKNRFELAIETDADHPAPVKKPADAGAPPNKSAKPSKPTGPSFSLMARLRQADANGDKQLTAAELEQANIRPDIPFAELDADGNGALDQTESQRIRESPQESAAK